MSKGDRLEFNDNNLHYYAMSFNPLTDCDCGIEAVDNEFLEQSVGCHGYWFFPTFVIRLPVL